jgi:murein DD-endopeptidase MepM/ murein hydrolase activator NlpD
VRLVHLAVVAALACTLLVAVAGASPASPTTRASALAVRVSVPAGSGATAGAVAAPPAASTVATPFAYPADGSVLTVQSASSSVAAQAGTSASAQGIADVLGVSLFAGEITAESVAARATVGAGAANASADVASSTVTGLVVLGQAVAVTPGSQIPLADWGVLDVLSRTTESTSAAPRHAHAAVTGLRVRVNVAHGGLAPGSEIVIGSADAVAQAAAAAPPPTPRPPAAPPRPRRPPQREDGGPALRTVTVPREPGKSIPGVPVGLVRDVPEGVLPRESGGGYTFPVYGPVSFGDSFAAPRSDVVGGWHHGEDLFAPLGTPLLAVADGTIFSVGWNEIGGWRLWLRDQRGNQFYYAHLSAYSPLAVNGRSVRAGDVVGFMGRSGDAEFSPPHLHFEIHPVSLLYLGYDGVIAPYPYLLAWRRAEDISFAAGRAYLPQRGRRGAQAPPVGAMLLAASDISRTSGLEPGALERALADRRAGEATLAVPGR